MCIRGSNFLSRLAHKFQTVLHTCQPSTSQVPPSVCLRLTPRPWHQQLQKTSHSSLSFLSFILPPSCQQAHVHTPPFSPCWLLSPPRNDPGDHRRGADVRFFLSFRRCSSAGQGALHLLWHGCGIMRKERGGWGGSVLLL